MSSRKPNLTEGGHATFGLRHILSAALALGEESGFDTLTVEGIAARTGVGKTTIYRRWPNVWAVAVDAILAEVNRARRSFESGAPARDSLSASMV